MQVAAVVGKRVPLSLLQAVAKLPDEVLFLNHLAHVQLCAGQRKLAVATAKEAAEVARRCGHRIWLAYAEWIMSGPNSPAFIRLIADTGAEHLTRFLHPSSAGNAQLIEPR